MRVKLSSQNANASSLRQAYARPWLLFWTQVHLGIIWGSTGHIYAISGQLAFSCRPQKIQLEPRPKGPNSAKVRRRSGPKMMASAVQQSCWVNVAFSLGCWRPGLRVPLREAYPIDSPMYSIDFPTYSIDIPRYAIDIPTYSIHFPTYLINVPTFPIDVPRYSIGISTYSVQSPTY